MTEQLRRALDATVKVSKQTEIAIPFTRKYFHPTPEFWRKLGDGLIIVGTTITSISAFTMPPIVTAVASIITAVGKVITNCAKAVD